MCSSAACGIRGRATSSGGGWHVDQVHSRVVRNERCVCGLVVRADTGVRSVLARSIDR